MEDADAILLLLRQGKKEGLEMLFRKYYALLVVYAYKFLKEKEEAEDVVQEVFVKFWQQDQFVAIQYYLHSYLFQSVRNRCLNILNEKKKFVCESLDGIGDIIADDVLSNEEWDKYLDSIHQEIEKLPEKTRIVFKSVFLEGKRYKEVAEEQDISVNTVKKLLSRAFMTLRHYLKSPSCVLFFFLRN